LLAVTGGLLEAKEKNAFCLKKAAAVYLKTETITL
jgi:hypothetical protein